MAKAEKRDPRWACKIGTMPKLVYVHGRDANRLLLADPPIGKFIKIREHPTQNWSAVLLNRVDRDGYFQADWM